MSRTYSLNMHAGSLEENSNLPAFSGSGSIGSDSENHTELSQPIVSGDLSICSPEALHSLFEANGYWFVPVCRESSRRGARRTPTLVLLPFSWDELLKRVLDLVNASGSKGLEKRIVFGDVCVDVARMEVIRQGRRVVLTAQEFKTLRFLILNPGRVISRDELLNQVWNTNGTR